MKKEKILNYIISALFILFLSSNLIYADKHSIQKKVVLEEALEISLEIPLT